MSSISNPAGSGTVTSTFALTSAITPTQLTADVNDYNPTSLSTASVLRLSSDASRDITGIDGGASGRMLVLHNIDAQPIVLKDESASSAAQNRFALAGDVTLSPDVAIQIQYDTTSNRWRLLGQPPGAGGVSDGDKGDVAISSAGAVYTVDSATAAFQLLGDLSPATIGANQNDYAPTNLATASVLRLATDASRDITGLAGGADGRLLIVHNVAAFNIVLKDESASSTAANRFALTGDLTLIPDAVALLQYDATSSRWRALHNGAPGATAAGLALIDDADAAAQKVTLGIASLFGSRNLTGENFVGNPTDVYGITADAVVLRDVSGNTFLNLAPGTEYATVTTAGPTAGGRDQAGAFSASSWVHIYWIGKTDGTIDAIASASASAPTLPSGYTHYCYAAAIRFNASSQLMFTYLRGDTCQYQAAQIIINAGNATTETAVSTAGAVPPNAKIVTLLAGLLAGSSQTQLQLGVATGVTLIVTPLQVANAWAYTVAIIPNVGQNVYYKIDVASGSVSSNVLAYSIPNGAN